MLAFVVPAIIGVLGRKRAMRRAEEVAMEGGDGGGGNKAR